MQQDYMVQQPRRPQLDLQGIWWMEFRDILDIKWPDSECNVIPSGHCSLSTTSIGIKVGMVVNWGRKKRQNCGVWIWDLQTQFVLDLTEQVDTFSGWDVDGLDVMFGQQSADLVCDTVLVRQHGYTGWLLALLLWFRSWI
jgi:hypothetical protein